MSAPQSESRGLHPVLGALVALAVFGAGAVGVQKVVSNLFIERALDPASAAVFQETVLSFVLGLGTILAFLVAVIVYLLLTAHRRMLRYMTTRVPDLVASQKQFEQLYEHSPVPYLLLSPQGHITNPNYAAVRLFGNSEDVLSGKQFFDLLIPDEGTVNPQELRERFERTIVLNNEEVRLVVQGGDTRWVLLSIFQIGDKAKRNHQGLATLVDITAQKEIDRAKTEFVSLASHQLKTPLSTMRWYVELLQDTRVGTLNDKQREYAGKIIEWDKRMTDLVDMLLNVSRIEMGTLQIDVAETEPQELITSVLEELQPQIVEKRLRIKRDEVGSTLPMLTDSKLLRVALQNLVSNAVKYTPEEGTVRVGVAENTDTVIFTVADTGYGIPPEQQSKIFTKMFRADNVREQGTKGTGLGLYLTKSFVERLGGTITFTSVLNEGTTFTITIPRQMHV